MRWLRLLLPLGLALHLGLSFWRTDAETAAATLRLSPAPLVLAALLALTPWLLNALRLWNWLRWIGEGRAYFDCLRIVAASELGAAVTPTALGGGSVKTAMLTSRGLPFSRALALTAMGSVEDGLFFLIAMPPLLLISGVWRDGRLRELLSGPESPAWRPLGLLLAALAALAILAVCLPAGRAALVWLRSAGGEAKHLWREIWHRRAGAGFVNLLLAGLQWSIRYSVFGALLAGMGIPADPLRVLVLQWLCFTLMAFVPTPGAMGGAELIFLALYAGALPADLQALVLSAWRITTFYLPNGVALLLLLSRRRRRAELWDALGTTGGG